MAKWKFRRMSRSEQNRDPTEAEFFRREDAIASLVRESIQNSLDAADRSGPVRVRFFISGHEGALPAARAAAWTSNLAPHLRIVYQERESLLGQSMPFLTVEDFGTHGLRGNHLIAHKGEMGPEDQDATQSFFYFWRNVGITGKVSAERGSWGLGKAVYASSSDICAVFGLTRRTAQPCALLMGQCVLKVHQREDANESIRHDAYGFFGKFDMEGQDPDFAIPLVGDDVLAFGRDFALEREGQNGLSIVIPHPAEDLCPPGEPPITTVQKYMRQVVEQYFYPILRDDLAVEVSTPSVSKRTDKTNLLDVVAELWPGADTAPHVNYLRLAKHALEQPTLISLVRDDDLSADWSRVRMSPGDLAVARASFTKQEPVGFKVPILVRQKDGTRTLSHFLVFLREDPSTKSGTVRFVRDGLTLSEIEGRTGSNVIGLVLVEDPPILKLVRDAENPAHTKWIGRSERLKKNYTGGAERIRFVEAAPRSLLKMILGAGEDRDRNLLAEFFPDADPQAEHPGTGPSPKTKKSKDNPDKPPLPKLPKTPQAIRLTKVSGGFVAVRVPGTQLPKRRVRIRVAFACIAGNPFRLYEPFDFVLDQAPIQVTIDGGVIESKIENEVVATIVDDSFKLTVTGFAPTRDIEVKHSWLDEEGA